MKIKHPKMIISILFFCTFILLSIYFCFSSNIEIIYNRNIEEILNKNIGSDIIINKVLFRKDYMVIFYRNKDKKSINFDKEMVFLYNLKQDKIVYNFPLNYNYFKNAIFYDDEQILLFTWNPTDIYSFNIDTRKFIKIYENEWEKNKLIFTLTDKLCYDNVGNVLSTLDVREKNDKITDDIAWCLLRVLNNKLEISKWFSDIKLKQDIMRYFNKQEDIPTLEYFSYPYGAFVLAIIDDKRKLLKLDLNREYQGRDHQFKIVEVSEDVGTLTDYYLDNQQNKDILLIIKKKGLFITEIHNQTNTISEKLLIDKKVLKARFLNNEKYIYFAYENNQVNFYISDIDKPLIKDFPYLLLTRIEKNNNVYTFLASNNENVAKIQIKLSK